MLHKEAKCHLNKKDCLSCKPMIDAARLVLKSKVVPLPFLWNSSFDGVSYDCEKAQRRLLQMPQAAITIDNRVSLVEKDSLQGANYESAKRKITFRHSPQEINYTSRADFNSLLTFATLSEPEKEFLKHTICSGYNLSKRNASKLYGISRLKKRSGKVSAASKTAKEIQTRTKTLAKEEKRVYLISCRVDPKSILSDSSQSDGSDFSDDTEVSLESLDSDLDGEVNTNDLIEVQKKGRWAEEHYRPATNSERDARPDDRWNVPVLDVNADNRETTLENVITESGSKVARKEFEKTDKSNGWSEDKDTPERNSWRHAKPDGSLKDTPVIDVNSVVVLDKLREVLWNWFAFVTLLEEQFKNQGYTSAVFINF